MGLVDSKRDKETGKLDGRLVAFPTQAQVDEGDLELTVAAFNLAERWQLPVFLLTEQALCQSKATLPAMCGVAIEVPLNIA